MAAPIIGEYGIGIRFAWRSFLQGDWVVAVLENLQPPLAVAVITITTQFLLTIVGRCGRPSFLNRVPMARRLKSSRPARPAARERQQMWLKIYKDFHIATFQNADGKWIARIRKADGSPVTVDLPGSTGPREYLDTDSTLTSTDAIKTAKLCVDGGSIK